MLYFEASPFRLATSFTCYPLPLSGEFPGTDVTVDEHAVPRLADETRGQLLCFCFCICFIVVVVVIVVVAVITSASVFSSARVETATRGAGPYLRLPWYIFPPPFPLRPTETPYLPTLISLTLLSMHAAFRL